MTRLCRAALLIGGLVALQACASADRFGGGSGGASGEDLAPAALEPLEPARPAPNSPEYFAQTIGDRVLFEVDQATLTASGRSTLDGQARWLTENGVFQAVIEGHADEQGTREYNLALGARRANAVKEYLVSQGIPESRLRVVSYGKERPIEICSDEACYAKNRRAVTIISGGLTS
ncbi:peptidoglycan-associated lipoprotein Pal [Pseudaestuariivita sp.]|uniref:peptidoglycan-associated lipoprotein Pal n=1 Tax=Pseudaestuariivita sp. TaxID=2211669 RepID=UPI00405A17C8